MKSNRYMVLDVETTTHNQITYDIGYVVCDRKGRIEHYGHSLVKEVITSPELMREAFYHRKIYERYIPMLSHGEIAVRPWCEISADIQQAIRDYSVNVVCAYNLAFDANALRKMQGLYADGAPMLTDQQKTLDIWALACMTRLHTMRFRNVAELMNWKTEKGNFLTSAEIAYRFLSGDHEFKEDHTALADAIIEARILAECLRSKVKLPYNQLVSHPWKIVNGK